MKLTYKELAAIIGRMTEEQQQCDVTVGLGISDEVLPMNHLEITSQSTEFAGILDDGHPVIVIEY